MIRARLSNGVFLLGVDAQNMQRLMNGKPLYVDLSAIGGHDTFVLMYGKTLADVMRELETMGFDIPPAQPFDEGNA
jgi:hypothetical protein